MDNKEKLEEAKRLYETANADQKYVLERLFPELRESEDERIRKELISFLKSPFVNENITDEKVTPWIAWLEQQDEQKPVISDDALREGIAHFGITQYQIDNWLKKYVDVRKQGEPKQEWKPSDVQMTALKEVCDGHWEPDGLDPLYKLWEQLSKLREE